MTATAGDAPISKGEQTRTAILDAAIARFGREGYRATSVADIARDAGVSGTAAYAYFANKEALFLAALDEDAAGVIHEGVSGVLAEGSNAKEWRTSLILTLVVALERHPLARRVLSGHEPGVPERVADIPAMTELRKTVAERLRSDQAAGLVRTDIDPVAVANGTVTIILSLLMAALQFGDDMVSTLGPDVWTVFQAAFDPPPLR